MSDAVQTVGRGGRDLLLVTLMVTLAALGGYGASEYRHWEAANTPAAAVDTTLRVPAEISIPLGEPGRIEAQTAGRKVQWLILNEGLTGVPIDNRAIWVYAAKPGTYRVACWTCVGNLPTPNQITVVHVGEGPAKTDTTAKADQP